MFVLTHVHVIYVVVVLRVQVMDALSVGPDLLTEIRYALHTEQRKVAVAYLLLLDKKRKEEQGI